MTAQKLPVIIDTDPGVDDAIALLFAFLSPSIDIRAITLTQGNTHIDNAFRNIKQILSVQDAHAKFLSSASAKDASIVPPAHWVERSEPITIAKGQGKPLEGDATYAHYYHGEDGLGNYFTINSPQSDKATQSVTAATSAAGGDTTGADAEGLYRLSDRLAEDEIIWQLENNPEHTITLIALGPLSNVARALQKNPKAMSRVKQVITMGGAIDHPGNITPVAEFNWYADALAAHLLIASDLPVKVLPLDVTMKSAIVDSKYLYEHVKPLNSPLSQFVGTIIEYVLDLTEHAWGFRWLTMHDPLTIACIVDPSFVTFKPLHFEVEPSGKFTKAMCVIDRRAPRNDESAPEITKRTNIEVATHGDLRSFLRLFYKTLFGLDYDTIDPVEKEAVRA
ncbi:Inosine/uridine-preferring nucleoside hydrolase domain-containing protein [Phlyctochytrium arcticum]|nr:Inosine/uridine-preferring nucleoside hydrolase domain-containing protein [Phlyctochytrium arcticum]